MWAPAWLALLSSLTYGASDYASGRLTARVSAALIVLSTALAQSLVMLIVALATRTPFSDIGFGAGALGGLFGALALITYYRALGRGPAGVVAPIVAASSALPVLVSLVLGAPLEPTTLAGLISVLIGLVVLTRQADPLPNPGPGTPETGSVRPAILALIAAVCFGVAFLVIDAGADVARESTWWVLCGVQVGALPMPFVLSRLLGSGERLHWVDARNSWVGLVSVTALNLVADAALVLALRDGSVGIVSVLASLAPAVTIALANALTRERLTLSQSWGAGLTLAGTLLVVATTG